jgi:hypothetical protein
MKTGEQLRDEGLALIEAKRHDWLQKARLEAMMIARQRKTVTINEVREVIQLPEDFSPNTWGAVFKCKDFKAIGYEKASHPEAHARVIRIYTLKEYCAD